MNSIASDIIGFFRDFEKENPIDVIPFLEKNKSIFIYKGFGTPENEMKFMHDVFLYIYKKYQKFKEFSWEQYVSYNDNYDHFMIEDIMINGFIDAESGIDFTWDLQSENEMKRYLFLRVYEDERDEIEFCKKHKIELEKLYDSDKYDLFYDFVKNKYEHLEKPTELFILFLKLLDCKFSMYYFLYTFGNANKVVFKKDGVEIIKREYSPHTELGFDAGF